MNSVQKKTAAPEQRLRLRNGLTYTAVADLSPDDLERLRDAFLHA
jgi:hypothetical protein